MKCPIKKLESDCIEKECPLYREGPKRCGVALAAESLECIAASVELISLTLEER